MVEDCRNFDPEERGNPLWEQYSVSAGVSIPVALLHEG
jgi:hypothetical protein